MIIDSPLLLALALGTDRRVPQEGDAQVILPNTLFPIVPVMQPTREVPSAGVAVQESACRDNGFRTNNNQAASADTLITLPPGLYFLDLSLQAMGAVNQPLTVADTGVRITMDFGNTSTTLLGVCIGGGVPVHESLTVQVLMATQFILVHRVNVTAVGQTILSRCTVNARRIL